jgi:O-antigen ligase
MFQSEEQASAERSLELGGLLLAMVFAGGVLAFGGVMPVAYGLMEVGILAAAILCFWRGWQRIPRLALLVLAVIVGLPFLQLVPLPSGLTALLSPNRGVFAAQLLSSFSPSPAYLALSLNPHATQVAVSKLIACILAFLIGHKLAVHGRGSILLRTLVIIGLFEACYGLVQYLAGWQYIFTYRKVFGADDATGTYINHNHFAGLLEMVLPFVLAGVLFRHRSNANLGIRRKLAVMLGSERNFRVLAQVMVLAVLSLALVFSRSRMGIAAGLSGLLLVGGLQTLRYRKGSAVAMLLVLLLVPVCYASWVGVEAVTARFEMLGRAGAMERDRLPIWRDSLRAIGDFKWTGTGLGTYEWASLHYQTSFLSNRYEHAHNDYLEFAAEIGTPAAALLFAGLWVLLLRAARTAVRSSHRSAAILAAGSAGALAAVLLHSVTDFNLQIPANALLFCWVAGTAMGVSCESANQRTRAAVSLPGAHGEVSPAESAG